MKRLKRLAVALRRPARGRGRDEVRAVAGTGATSDVTRIKLMTDYLCRPLWWIPDDDHPERLGDFDPATLPLSTETLAALERWQDWYDGHLDLVDPHRMYESWSSDEADAFERAGVELWHRLRGELGEGYDVAYFSPKRGKILGHPRELAE